MDGEIAATIKEGCMGRLACVDFLTGIAVEFDIGKFGLLKVLPNKERGRTDFGPVRRVLEGTIPASHVVIVSVFGVSIVVMIGWTGKSERGAKNNRRAANGILCALCECGGTGSRIVSSDASKKS